MTWKEIKQAVEKAGIKESDDIYILECERQNGDKVLHKSKSGNMIKLVERIAEQKVETHGCAT